MRTSHCVNRPAYGGMLAASGPRQGPQPRPQPQPQARHRPRHRAPRRRTGAAAVLVAVGLALVLSGPGGRAAPAFAATDQPTVEFLGDGPAPLACSSTPSVPNLTVQQNSRIVLANFTGADATANIGDGRTVSVSDGKAVSVKLKAGSYAITMTPNCFGTYNVGTTVITVVKSEVAPLPSPPSPAPSSPASTGPVGPPSAAPRPAVGDAWSGRASTSPSPSGPLASGVGPSGEAVPGSSDSSDPDVREALAVPPPSGPDHRGDRLLALIAAICVFGVTTAIIRAIVAQRATGAPGI